MKKTVLIIATLFLAFVVSAQEEFEPETYFGIKLGANTAGIFSDPLIYQKINPGFASGLVFKHVSQKNMGIQMELNYNQVGWSENLDSTNTYKRRLDYIQLPFMTQITLGKQKTQYVINLGPYVSYLLSDKEEINLVDEDEEKSYYGQNVRNKAEIGFCFGLGVLRHTSMGLFQLELRGSTSITDVFKNTTDSPYASSKNINAEITLAYMIDYKIFKKSDKILD